MECFITASFEESRDRKSFLEDGDDLLYQTGGIITKTISGSSAWAPNPTPSIIISY